MIHLPQFIQDLAVILMVAGAMALLFQAIRQPVVLGYIVAGILVGPHVKWLPTVLDGESVKVWAEIGVIFLLFALGLEFSFKKLARVGVPAATTALVEVFGMVVVGYFTGRAFGWSGFDSIFLGGILAISSTTIIFRAFEELGMKTRGFSKLVFGVLIVEDLFAILLMVVLSTLAVSRSFSGVEMGFATLKLVFFLVLWFVLGIFLIPSLLGRARRHLRPETLLVVSLGLCFLMVVLATKAGFSPALGAFIMGSILAETVDGERVEELVHPLKDLFGAIFFVSVGMLIDPAILAEHAIPITIITAITIAGKLLTTVSGALLAGQSLRHSVQAGMSLEQIGEFSFIIAGLGLSLNVTSDFLYPVAISVSVITTFTTPYLIRSADGVVKTLEGRLSPRMIQRLERFRVASATVSQTGAWRELLKKAAMKITANAVIATGIFLSAAQLLKPWLIDQDIDRPLAGIISLGVALIVSAPFLWAIAGGRLAQKEAGTLWKQGRFTSPLVAFELSRWVFAAALVALLSSRIVSPGSVIMAAVALAIAIVFLSNRFGDIYLALERRFVMNLNEREANDGGRTLPALAPWDSHLAELKVSTDSPLAGRKLAELMVREKFGVTIALIRRGHRILAAPTRDDMLFPGDGLSVIGSDDEIARFREVCEAATPTNEEDASVAQEYILKPIVVEADAPYAGKSIRDSGLRERAHGLVVGIEKQGQRILNPDSSLVIEPGDILWLVGDQRLM